MQRWSILSHSLRLGYRAIGARFDAAGVARGRGIAAVCFTATGGLFGLKGWARGFGGTAALDMWALA